MAHSLFRAFRDESLLVVTGDQDWAPDWALAAAVELVAEAGVPYHLFVTNESPTVTNADATDLLSLGIHPNFLAGSTQGATPDGVIDTCLALVPDATSFRTHSLCEDNYVLRDLATRGFIADSNVLAFFQPDLVPLLHAAGFLRIPIFFEDDWFLEWAAPELDLRVAKRQLLTPGIKLLNLHPVLLAINAPSMEYYNSRRGDLYGEAGGLPLEAHQGRGVATVFSELVGFAAEAGLRVTSFPRLVEEALAAVEETYGDDLYGWPRHPLLQGAARTQTRARMPSR